MDLWLRNYYIVQFDSDITHLWTEQVSDNVSKLFQIFRLTTI